jgi:hypothetical protein
MLAPKQIKGKMKMAGRVSETPRPIERDGSGERADVDIRVSLYVPCCQRPTFQPGKMPFELSVLSHSRLGAFAPKQGDQSSRPGLSPKPPVGLLLSDGAHPLKFHSVYGG